MFSEPSLAQPTRLRWPVLKPVGQDPDSPFVRVNRQTCVVGDRSPVHLPLRSPMVSRTHALIIVDGDEVYIRDLASSNRLYVNGMAVREAALRTADLLQVGPFRFRCYAGFSRGAGLQGAVDLAKRPSLEIAGSGRSRPIDARTFVIGRRAECDLPLGSSAVSQVHAVIFRRGKLHFIRDLNSRCGTIVNGCRVREAELKDGDELRIATAILRFRIKLGKSLEPTEIAALGDSGSWLAAELWSSSPGGLSLSKSVGAQTVESATENGGQDGQDGPQPLDLQAPDATPEDLGLTEDISFVPAANVEISADLGLASAADLFSSEISLAGGRILPVGANHRVRPCP